MKIKLQIDNGDDWAQVRVDGEVVFRGHAYEAKEAALALAGIEESCERVTGPRVDDVVCLIEELTKRTQEQADLDEPIRMWVDALGIVRPSEDMLVKVGRMVVEHLKQSSGRARGPAEPVMQAHLMVVAS